MEQNNKYSILDGKYEILFYLDSGTQGKIKLVRLIQDKQKIFVAKQLKEDSDPQELLKEYEILQQGVGANNEGHKNVLRAYELKLDGIKKKKQNRGNKQVQYMIMDYAENGCLFDYVKAMGGFHKGFCKFYLKEMMEGLQFLHQKGICHRDIKLENILLDREYVLKIADLGYAGRTGILLQENLGTQSYKPPEINGNKEYYGDKADVFSSGVTFFLMNCCFYPFSRATMNNANYVNFVHNNQLFWQHQREQMEQRELDVSIMNNQNFIKLMNGMWDSNPDTRWSVQQVLESEYLNEADLIGENQTININQQLVKHNLQQYRDQVNAERQQEREEQKAQNNEMEEEDDDEPTGSRAVPEDLEGQINDIQSKYEEKLPEKFDFPVAADMKGLDNSKIQLVLQNHEVIPVIIYIFQNLKLDGYDFQSIVSISEISHGKVIAQYVDKDGNGDVLKVSSSVAVQKGDKEERYNIFDIRIARRDGGYVEYRELIDKFHKESKQFL